MMWNLFYLLLYLWVCSTAATYMAPITSMPALPQQTIMPPPKPGETRYQTITISPNHPLQAGYPYDPSRPTSYGFLTTVNIKNPQLSSCWNDNLKEVLKLAKSPHVTTSFYQTQTVNYRTGINTSIPLIIRCDGRTYLPATTLLIYATTTIHPPILAWTVYRYTWTPSPSCSALKPSACAEGSQAASVARSSAISSIYSKWWPSIPTLAANRSVTTIVVPRNGGPWGTGGMAPSLLFDGETEPFGDFHICRFPQLKTCPIRAEIKDCELSVPTMTVYYWPTSSAGSFCGPKTRIPFPMTIPGEPNTIHIENDRLPQPLKTVVTSPSALVVLPVVNRRYNSLKSSKDPGEQTWELCGEDFQTSATFQIHPDDISQVNPHYISTTAVWTTEDNKGKSVYSTLYRTEMTSEPVDFAAVHNPAWLKQLSYDNTVKCEKDIGIYGKSHVSTTITESQVESSKQTNCQMGVLTWQDSPAVAIPWRSLWKVLDQDWLNWGGNPDANKEPFCKPDPSMFHHVEFVALTGATLSGSGLQQNTEIPHVDKTETLTTLPASWLS